jgi:hypothetical protein
LLNRRSATALRVSTWATTGQRSKFTHTQKKKKEKKE